MGARNYPRLSIYDFGAQLLESGDLDPVYIGLAEAELDPDQLARWLVAYWCYYHVGAACYISEARGSEFWGRMSIAAGNFSPAPTGGRWPRGSERRHFRGEAAISAVSKMSALYGEEPEQIVEGFIMGDQERRPFADVARQAQQLPLFGPWIAFKVADMLDRLAICPVDFDQAAVFMFQDPVKAALLLWRQKMDLPDSAKPRDQAHVINEVVSHLTAHFSSFTAPPTHERAVGLQEIETILCKWKSHLNGHYPLYNDIDEIRHGLDEWLQLSDTAKALSHSLPRRP